MKPNRLTGSQPQGISHHYRKGIPLRRQDLHRLRPIPATVRFKYVNKDGEEQTSAGNEDELNEVDLAELAAATKRKKQTANSKKAQGKTFKKYNKKLRSCILPNS